MAYIQNKNRGNFKKTGKGISSGLLMGSGSPLNKDFPVTKKTKLKSYEGLLNKKDGTYAAAGSEEAEAMMAEAKRTGNYSLLEGLTNTNKLGLQSKIDEKTGLPQFSVSPQVSNSLYGLPETEGMDVDTGEFVMTDPEVQQMKQGQFAADAAEMVQGYNYYSSDKADRGTFQNRGVDTNLQTIPADQGYATQTSSGEDIFTTGRAGIGKDLISNARALPRLSSDENGNKSLVSVPRNKQEDLTRLTDQNLNFNRSYNLGATGAFTLNDFRGRLEENPKAFYADDNTSLAARLRNTGNRADQPNTRDSYASLDFRGDQQRGRRTGYTSSSDKNQQFTNMLIKDAERKNPKFSYERKPSMVQNKYYEKNRYNPFGEPIRTN